MSKNQTKSDRLPELALVQGPVLIIVHATGVDDGFDHLKSLVLRDYPSITSCRVILTTELASIRIKEVLNYSYVVSLFPTIDDFRNDIIASFMGMLGEFVVSGRSYNSVFPKWPVLLRATRRELAAWFVYLAYAHELTFKYVHMANARDSDIANGSFGEAVEKVAPSVEKFLKDNPHLSVSLDSYAYSSSKHRKFVLQILESLVPGSASAGSKVPAQCNFPSPICKYNRTLANKIDVSSLLESSLSKVLPRFIVNRLNHDTFN